MRHPKPRVRKYPWGGENSAWVVDGLRTAEGRRYRKFFKTEREAKTWLEAELVKLKNEGLAAHTLTNEERVIARKALDVLAPVNGSLIEAAEFYRKHIEAVRRSRSVADAIPEYVAAKTADGAKSRYLSDIRSRLKRFEEDFPTRMLADFDKGAMKDWLRGLKVAPQTRNNFQRVLKDFFSWAVSEMHYAIENPIAGIKPMKVVRERVAIFTPEEIRRLLSEADTALLPSLTIGAFAGLRSAEIDRLDWSNVRLDRGHIEVTEVSAKTASRRLVTIQPNLVAWLAPHARKSGPVLCANARRLLDQAVRDTKTETESAIKWRHNGLRHSFASYLLDLWQDAAKVSLQLGHASQAVIFRHYREVVQPVTGAEWFGIMPPKSGENVIPMGSANAAG